MRKITLTARAMNKVMDLIKREKKSKASETKGQTKAKPQYDMIKYIHKFVEDMKKDKILYRVGNTRRHYSRNTVNGWVVFRNLMDRIYQEKPFNWKDMNERFNDRMITFMENRGMMASYINKEIKCLKHICRFYNEKRICKVNVGRLYGLHREDGDAKTKVYLTKTEIRALYHMQLCGLEDKVRDLFLVECCSGQRYSDACRLTRDMFRVTAEGNTVFHLKQQKTLQERTFPIVSNKLLKILDKYDYHLPVLRQSTVNKHIKIILQRLSKQVTSLNEDVKTAITAREYIKEHRGERTFRHDNEGHIIKPKYECVSTHTGRRSAATNMYLSKDKYGRRHFSLRQIMKVTGHTKETTLLAYLCQKDEEEADEVASIIGAGIF